MIKSVALRRVARIFNGGTPTPDPANWAGNVLWATPIDLGINDGGTVSSTARTLTQRGLDTGSQLVPAGSIIVSTRAPIGYMAITTAPLAFNQGCKGITPRSNTNGRFLKYALMSRVDMMRADGSGSTFMELSTDALARTLVSWTGDRDRQVRIADFLDDQVARIDKIIATRRQQIIAAQTVPFAGFASKLDSVGARLAPLRRFLVDIADGPFGSAFASADYSLTGPAVIRLGNIGLAEFQRADIERVPTEIFDRFPRCHVEGGELLIASLGDGRNHAGRACVAPDNLGPAMVKGKCFRVQVNARLADPTFLAVVLSSMIGVEALAQFGRGATRTMLNIDLVSSVELPMPTLSMQRRLRDEYLQEKASISVAVHTLKTTVTLMEELKRGLITAAVTGEFDVSSADGSGMRV